MSVACIVTPAFGEAVAGSAITNVAVLRIVSNDVISEVRSNETRDVVAERLDVVVLPIRGDGSVSDIVAAAVVVNNGNGSENFEVTATAGATVLKITADGDGDGRYDPSRDPELPKGQVVALAPGGRVTVFAVLGATGPGVVTIAAAAATGSGQPGTAFLGRGDGGSDAVVGSTGARASVDVLYGSPDGAATLTKSAIVLAPDGSARAISGAVITYTLVARFAGAVADGYLADPIPSGVAYVPASMSLDGVPLTDEGDDDAGTSSPGRVAVALDDQAAGAAHTFRFSVIIP